MKVVTEKCTNKDVMVFHVQKKLDEVFTDSEIQKYGWSRRICQIPGVEDVCCFGQRHSFTVHKGKLFSWRDIIPKVIQVLREELGPKEVSPLDGTTTISLSETFKFDASDFEKIVSKNQDGSGIFGRIAHCNDDGTVTVSIGGPGPMFFGVDFKGNPVYVDADGRACHKLREPRPEKWVIYDPKDNYNTWRGVMRWFAKLNDMPKTHLFDSYADAKEKVESYTGITWWRSSVVIVTEKEARRIEASR